MENSEKKVVDSENPKAGITNNEQMVEVAVTPIAVQTPTVETKEIVVETPVAIESGKLTNTQVSLYGSVDVVVFGEPGEVCDGLGLFSCSYPVVLLRVDYQSDQRQVPDRVQTRDEEEGNKAGKRFGDQG